METQPLTLSERKELLALARTTLEERLAGQPRHPAPDPERFPCLHQPRGAFVTLHARGRLRGCIGTFRAREPLYQVVREMALSAAFNDPRFRPVTAGELPDLEIEISALTPLVEVAEIGEIQVGVHGLYITRGYSSGVLLPQVAVEWGWDREQFLEHTCEKAGLPMDAWKKGATIERFSADVFSESDPEGGKVTCA
ncbi:MAG: AmmeMemoRadiSam system protein A [Deltaproteobacteria bacterium]|nr:AmmeMemoRadiSam system protein A [Deltaproteobacteria bacterium]